MKNETLTALTVIFLVATLVTGIALYKQTEKVKNLNNELNKQQQNTDANNKENTQQQTLIQTLKQQNKDIQTNNKELETELKQKSLELLKATTTQRTTYEEQRAKWRNYAAAIMSDMVKDLEHTAQKCWDSDRDDYEDCIDDEFEDDTDKPINQVLNLA